MATVLRAQENERFRLEEDIHSFEEKMRQVYPNPEFLWQWKDSLNFFRTFETFLQILTQFDFLQMTSPQSSCQELTLFSPFWVYEFMNHSPDVSMTELLGKLSYYKRGGLVYSLHVVDPEMVKCCHSIWGFTKVEWTAWRTHHEHLVPSLKLR